LSSDQPEDANHFPYTHHHSIDDFYDSISHVITDQIVQALKTSPFFAVQIDEATDCSNLATLMIYVRFLDDKGQIQSKFLSVVELKNGSAQTIFDALIFVLQSKDIDVTKMIALASDGASVMTGEKNGVSTLAKNINPYLISTHCLAHRLALASEKAAKQVPYLVKYLEIVNRLGKLCKFSGKFCNILNESKRLHNEDSGGKLKQVFFTRWLSFNDCVEALVGCMNSLISALHSTSKDKSHGVTATGILKNVSCYKFIATTYFCADVIGILATLCKTMQKSSSYFIYIISFSFTS
jgi:hypothetical protein